MSSRGYKAWLGCDRLPASRLPQGWGFGHVAGVPGDGGEVQRTAIEELLGGLEALTGLRPTVAADAPGALAAASAEPAGAAGSAGSAVERQVAAVRAIDPQVTGERAVERQTVERGDAPRFIAAGVMGAMPLVDAAISDEEAATLPEEAFVIREAVAGEGRYVAIVGKSERGLLYGVFHFLRLLQSGGLEEASPLDITERPAFGLRMINQWDNMDGSVERGYSGNSIFYRNFEVLADSPRIRDYARLLSSVGVNGIAINNVNVHREETKLITERYLPDVAKVAGVFRAYGIKLYLSVNFAGPVELGELETADPLDADVQAWWSERARDVYRHIPDFGGFLVKADSENRPGPFTYGRDHADGANMLADALKPHGGIVLWRCFVYNCHQDWRDRSTDRAKAAYDHFKPLDGRFRDNVILQIKNGPMDFQVREPVSPLFGAIPHTNQIMEFQIAQEYTGQQRDVCFLVPQWKEVLDFDTRLKGEGTTIKEIAAGRAHSHTHGGVTAVSNIGDDDNWTGHHLAQANLYGYGRLMWNPGLSSERIATEWTRQTFGGAAGESGKGGAGSLNGGATPGSGELAGGAKSTVDSGMPSSERGAPASGSMPSSGRGALASGSMPSSGRGAPASGGMPSSGRDEPASGGGASEVEATVVGWLLSSWRTYENYTAPLGVGWMVRPHYHYGPDVDGYEYSKWGTYHFADHKGIGVDRTVAAGTGYAGQYEAANAARYESLADCPDELLLFFHHVPYTHKLHSGKTVIQHIYDTHFEGAEQAEAALDAWLALEGKIDEERFRHVADRVKDQIDNARLWRDVINTYFYRKSGIPDERGRTIY